MTGLSIEIQRPLHEWSEDWRCIHCGVDVESTTLGSPCPDRKEKNMTPSPEEKKAVEEAARRGAYDTGRKRPAPDPKTLHGKVVVAADGTEIGTVTEVNPSLRTVTVQLFPDDGG